MDRKYFLPIIALIALAVAAIFLWPGRHPSTPPGTTLPGAAAKDGVSVAPTSVPSSPVAARLDDTLARISASRDSTANRLTLADLRSWLASLPPEVASRELQTFLASARDARTNLEITIQPDGGLGDASSLRVFLLDHLGRIDRAAAGAIAAQILARETQPDEWAICLRNYAWANPGPDSELFLQAKARQLLGQPAWLGNPSTGFLEAFDTIVYAHGTALVPELAALARDQEKRATAHAAYLTLDRLTINEPALVLKQLLDQPDLLTGREQSRASFFARADVRIPEQRALVEQYLLDPGRDVGELATFGGLYPNANFMISNNLLTKVQTPTGAQLAAHDREALRTVEQWQADPRFERLKPLLGQIHERLKNFVK